MINVHPKLCRMTWPSLRTNLLVETPTLAVCIEIGFPTSAPTELNEGGGHNSPFSRERDPADLVEQSDLHALLRRLIEQLPRSQREVIDLWSDGFSYIQISEITSQTEGHIRVLVHRGLKAIREHPQVRLIVEEEDELVTVRNAREKVCKH